MEKKKIKKKKKKKMFKSDYKLINDLGYKESPIKSYWCHICNKQFFFPYIEKLDIQCKYCGNTFCEEIERNESSNQSISSSSSETNINNRNNLPPLLRLIYGMNRPRTSHGLLDFILNFLALRNYEDNIENLINQIMMNDPNKYGNPPASKKSIEELERFTVTQMKLKSFGVENSCAVCKDEFEIGQELILMPCKHYFHIDCLIPWLNERNSCPVCRFELPTDDVDFENRKRNGNNNH